MITYKIRYEKYIACLSVPKKHNGKTIVVLPGLPASSNNKDFIKFLLSLGCAVLQPDYTGAGNSDGVFSVKQCTDDIGNFIKLARKHTYKELYYSKWIKIETESVIVIASSFGTTATILAEDLRVDRLILISPIFVYNQRDITRLDKNYNFKEQVTALYNLITKAFKYTYRIDNLSEFKSDLLGLSRTTSTNNIIEHLRRISVPTLVIQGNLDFSLSASITSNILNKVNNGNISLKFIPDTGHSVNDLSVML